MSSVSPGTSPPPDLSVDLGSAVPPFEQIRSQVTELIATGALAPGSRLPTVRALAADLGIAVGTVARAYRELESAGFVESRRRHGTTVSGAPPTPTPAEVAEAADQLLTRARAAGLGWEDLLGLLGRRRDLLEGPPAPAGPGTGSAPRR